MTSYKQRAYNDFQRMIADKRAEAERLENERGLSARQAMENVAKAKQLRADAEWLERNYGSHEVQAWLKEQADVLTLQEDQNQRKANQAFSDLQNELLGVEDERNERIQDAFNAVVYNGAIGIPKSTLMRQLGKLIDGEGEIDGKGNRYVRFSEGNSAVYRAVVTQEGHYGFVLEGRGDDQHSNI